MTVFVVHPINSNGVNIEDARRFGELQFVNDRYAYPDEMTEDHQLPTMFRVALREAAERFNPETDYILIAGDYVQLVALSAMISGSLERHGVPARLAYFNVLRWVRDANAYMPVRIQT